MLHKQTCRWAGPAVRFPGNRNSTQHWRPSAEEEEEEQEEEEEEEEGAVTWPAGLNHLPRHTVYQSHRGFSITRAPAKGWWDAHSVRLSLL